MKCTYCSTPVPDGAIYCHQCGSQVSDAEGQAAASASITDSGVQHITQLVQRDTKGEFEILRQLGRGGMAVVFLAHEIHLDRNVAMKVLPPELTFGHGIERFKREAKTAAALDHPNIIPIYRIATGGTIFWYTMKYLEGRSLEQMLKELNRLSLDETIRIVKAVADALQYAHARQVIHRDVKPANVMIDVQGRVMVTDFGIAKALTEATLTASGSVVGTPYFMSPEQAMGLPVSPASDQYSLAVVTYRTLSGQVPFEGTSAVDILQKHCTVPPPPLDVLRPGLPTHVYQAVNKGLSKEAARRFTSVNAFAKGLEEPSPEISAADLRTEQMRSDPSMQDRISTEVIAIVEQKAEQKKKEKKTASVKSRERGTRSRRSVFVVGLAVVAGAAGLGWWLGQRGGVGDESVRSSTEVEQQTVPSDSTGQVAAQDSALAEPAGASLTLAGLPADARVWIDGERVAGSDFDLDPGTHTLRIAAAGFETVTDNVELISGERLRHVFSNRRIVVQAEPERQLTERQPEIQPPPPTAPGFLQIGVSPWANVSIDGEAIGRMTIRVDTLPPGEHRVVLERSGFRTVDTTVVIQSDETVLVRIQLVRSPT